MSLLHRFPRTHVLLVLMISVPLASWFLFNGAGHSSRHPATTEMNIVPLPFVSGTIEELTQWSRDQRLTPQADSDAVDSSPADLREDVERVHTGDNLSR